MADDDKVILTAEQAISLLPDGEYIHNYANPTAAMLLGVDYDRADAIKAIQSAVLIELGGPASKSLKHPIVVWNTKNHYTFFQANMEKVEAFEKGRAPGAHQ